MNELLLDYVLMISNTLYLAFAAICIFNFYTGVFQVKSKLKYIIPLGYFICMAFLKLMPWVIDAYIAHFLGVLSTFVLSYVVYPKNMPLKLYISITFLAFTYLIHYISTAIWQLVVVNIPYEYLENIVAIIIIEGEIFLLFKGFVLLFCVKIITGKLKDCTINFSLSTFFILVLPSIIGFLGGVFIFNFYYESNVESFPYNEIVVILSGSIFILGIITNAILFQNLKKNQEMEKEKWYLKKQIETVSDSIKKTENLYAGIKGLKHDLKNHSINIKHLIEEKQYEQAQEYALEFEKAINMLEYRYSTGNAVTDVIINEFAGEFTGNGIDFKTQFLFPLNTKINSFDVSVILNNALQNALEACLYASEHVQPKVSITAFKKNNTYLIEVANTCYNQMIFDENGMPQTSKTDKEIHGMGLKNIEKIANKYHGDINIEIKDNVFTLIIMLIAQ